MTLSPIAHSRPDIGASEMAAVQMCLMDRMMAEGDRSRRLEAALSRVFAGAGAVVCGSGTQALVLALRAIGAGPGRNVILPTYVCHEVLGAVEHVGATPVLADIGENFLLDPTDAGRVLSPQTAAVIVPLLFGIGAAMEPYAALGVPVIADCAQFMPSAEVPPPDADLTVLSFGGTKMISAGEGGAVLSRRPDLLRGIEGQKRLDGGPHALNLYPLSDLQAGVLSAQVERLASMTTRRRDIAQRYFTAFEGVAALRLPTALRHRSVFFRFPIGLSDGGAVDRTMDGCARLGVTTRRPVAHMLHHLRPASRGFPMADRLFERTLSIPIYSALTDADVERVVGALLNTVTT